MELPLLERISAHDGTFPAIEAAEGTMSSFCGYGAEVLPAAPGPGEQYRFHFDMTSCIGCKCCVVACNEQNGNPADILWRRVGEIEGGIYPHTLRHYLSMGCNHCLEPTCMTGCPVNAYTKDSVTGIVRHSADACIGCQYCTWNCSYGVPQYNPERGVVGKCDMCYGRLTQGQSPACVSACPEGAIRIETVRVSEWRAEYHASANSPGMPSADSSLSTTRITLPKRMPRDVRKVDLNRLHPEDPHWPLVVMTVLTQFSVGGFTSIWLLELLSTHVHRAAALVAFTIAAIALMASTLHLGRPIYAVRALKMWRRSWLSREVLLFSLFAGSAAAYSAALWLNLSAGWMLGGLTVLFGIAGVGASARLYMVPGRPAWNSPFTIADFFLTAALLGSAGANILNGASQWTHALAASTGLGTLLLGGTRLLWLMRSETHERQGSARLLTGALSSRLFVRYLCLCAGLVMLPLATLRWSMICVAAAFMAGEFISRHLFFVSVVPTNMATEYLAPEAA